MTPAQRRRLHQRAARGPVPRAAAEFLRGKRLRTSDHWSDVWREEHAATFTAARVTREDLVEDLHRELVRALGAGETKEAFVARVAPMLEQRGWRPPRRGGTVPKRLARIYRTNMRTARAAGHWARIERRADTAPYLLYLLGPSREHRPEHVAWANTILPVADPFWDRAMPPNGWGCNCRVQQITAAERGRRLREGGYTTERPDPPMRSWTNPATGEVRRVPAGFDPGWDVNPGRYRTLGIHARDSERLEDVLAGRRFPAAPAGLRREVARRRVQASLAGPGFRHFLQRPRPARPLPREGRPAFIEAVPVAVAPPSLTTAAGVEAQLLYLTAAAAERQWRRHGPGQRRPAPARTVPAAWWADIQAILDEVHPRRADGGRWIYESRGRRLVVARDAAGFLAVVAYHPAR